MREHLAPSRGGGSNGTLRNTELAGYLKPQNQLMNQKQGRTVLSRFSTYIYYHVTSCSRQA